MPLVSSLYISLDPSPEYKDHVHGCGELNKESQTDPYLRLLRSQFVDQRRYAGVQDKEFKYSYAGEGNIIHSSPENVPGRPKKRPLGA